MAPDLVPHFPLECLTAPHVWPDLMPQEGPPTRRTSPNLFLNDYKCPSNVSPRIQECDNNKLMSPTLQEPEPTLFFVSGVCP